MFKYLSIILLSLAFLCTNCSRPDKQLESILNHAENCLEHFPDSSLAILNQLKSDEISSASQKARYALLKSIALDKNYIDVTDDSLTSIAVVYYSKHGTAEECLKSYLYNGRVFINSKKYDEAMDNYLRAEECVKKSRDYIIAGRLYSAKSVLYNTIFQFRTAIEQANMASDYFLKGGDTTRFLNNLNNIAVIMNNSSLYDLADEYLQKIEQYWHKLTPSQKAVYYSVKLARLPQTDTVAIMAVVDKIIGLEKSKARINWLALADAYYKIGDYNSSLEYIEKHKPTGSITDATYYALLSEINSKIGDYEKAYKLLVKSDKLIQSRYYRSTQTDVKFLEERYSSQLKAIRHKYLILILGLGVLAVILVLSLLYKHHLEESNLRKKELEHLRLEKENYEMKCVDTLREYEKLKKIIEINKGKDKMDPNMLQLVKKRLAILDKVIAANISSAFSKEALKELDELMSNRGLFLDSTRQSFTLSHPKFIEYLLERNLSEREIACCCLYCIGLNGSEISNYLEMKSFYNISAVIRKKLCIDRSMNIDTYLRKIFHQLY